MKPKRIIAVYRKHNGNVELVIAVDRESIVTYLSQATSVELFVQEICDAMHEAGTETVVIGFDDSEQIPFSFPASAGPLNEPATEPEGDEIAEVMYESYCKAVGGKAFNGDALPTWKEMVADPKKERQVKAWRVAGEEAFQWTANRMK